MRVLLIDVNCKSSSTGQIVYNLYSYLNSHGDEAAVCYGRGEKIVERNIYKFGLDWETYLHAFLTRVTGFTGCFSFFSTRRLIKYIKKFKPDVVHIHELHAYFVNIKPLINYLKSNHIKTVMTLHCEFAYTGKCGHSMECERWKTECNQCPHLREYVSTLCFDRTRFMFRQKKELFEDFEELSIVTPSKWLAERASQSLLGNHEISVIHNGVDTSVFYPRDTRELRKQFNIADDEKVVLALAPHLMSEAKGGYYVLQLAKMLENEKIKFILVGVDEECQIEAANVFSKNPIKDKELISEYYSLADSFLICSKKENYPTTCLEAQACGTPVFGFDAGGVSETLVDGENNLVEYADVKALSNLIRDSKTKTKESAKELSQKSSVKNGLGAFSEQYFAKYTDNSNPVGGVILCNTILLPPQKNKDYIASLYSMADIYVLCSKKETYSMTCAEALCCGTKVLGFKCGAPEKIFKEPFAVFVEYGDIEGIRDMIMRTENNPQISKYGENNFSSVTMCGDYYQNSYVG